MKIHLKNPKQNSIEKSFNIWTYKKRENKKLIFHLTNEPTHLRRYSLNSLLFNELTALETSLPAILKTIK